MAITWDYTDVEGDLPMHLVEATIWATMSAGINHITEATKDEFYKRVNMVERLSGAFRVGYDEETGKHADILFTMEEVDSLVGFRTNVGHKSPTAFKNFLYDNHRF